MLPGGDPPDLPTAITEPVTPESLEEQAQQPDEATQPADSPEVAPADGEGFGDPVVDGEDTAIGTLPIDLIPSTPPDDRAAQVSRERSDPFALLPTAPVVDIPVPEEIEQGELAPIPELVPGQPIAPPQPIPEIARAIAVTGVVQLGNVPYAIVDAPNEPHSRYVREGQFLSNGEVLVKRINVNPGGEPVVIFEQFGIEVATTVGSGGIPDDPTATAAVAIFPLPQ